MQIICVFYTMCTDHAAPSQNRAIKKKVVYKRDFNNCIINDCATLANEILKILFVYTSYCRLFNVVIFELQNDFKLVAAIYVTFLRFY